MSERPDIFGQGAFVAPCAKLSSFPDLTTRDNRKGNQMDAIEILQYLFVGLIVTVAAQPVVSWLVG